MRIYCAFRKNLILDISIHRNGEDLNSKGEINSFMYFKIKIFIKLLIDSFSV